VKSAKLPGAHLAYCTNIHPAESWAETLHVLKTHTLQVRDHVSPANAPYAIGLRLSARAATELLQGDHLAQFKLWLEDENCYVFTINGFPYGSFHGTRVKEKVYQPDWTSSERLRYTQDLFTIIAQLVPEGVDGSVSTLPGSFKAFEADETAIFTHLEACAQYIENLSSQYGRDLHLGLEPEPLGHFENTEETIAFFERLLHFCSDPELIKKRIGINYDSCHFALEFDDCRTSLDTFRAAGLRISKLHLSSALEFNPSNLEAIEAIRAFDEPTYLHQVIVKNHDSSLKRFTDLPEFLNASEQMKNTELARVHFHIPLYAAPKEPLHSTQQHASDAINYLKSNSGFCSHLEIETYTWGVLPSELQIPIEEQIAREYDWVLNQ
jgi:hypothetical protein